jgi:hypothetical protein
MSTTQVQYYDCIVSTQRTCAWRTWTAERDAAKRAAAAMNFMSVFREMWLGLRDITTSWFCDSSIDGAK